MMGGKTSVEQSNLTYGNLSGRIKTERKKQNLDRATTRVDTGAIYEREQA
jgi:hypothetical protein